MSDALLATGATIMRAFGQGVFGNVPIYYAR